MEILSLVVLVAFLILFIFLLNKLINTVTSLFKEVIVQNEKNTTDIINAINENKTIIKESNKKIIETLNEVTSIE
jgi:predicted PurR-regulated permease PerM